MEHNPQKHRLRNLIDASGTAATFISDIFDAAQRKADVDEEELACQILDSGHEVLFELKRIELLADVREDIERTKSDVD